MRGSWLFSYYHFLGIHIILVYILLTSPWMGVYCVRVWKGRLALRMHIKTELRRYHTILCLRAWLIMKTEENVWEAFTRACQTALSTTLKNDEKEAKTQTSSGRIQRSLRVKHLHKQWNAAKNQRMACISRHRLAGLLCEQPWWKLKKKTIKIEPMHSQTQARLLLAW